MYRITFEDCSKLFINFLLVYFCYKLIGLKLMQLHTYICLIYFIKVLSLILSVFFSAV